MKQLSINTDPAVKEVFGKYPPAIRKKMKSLRKLIIETAREMDDVSEIDETLKWGEPSYIAKKGSTFRIDWKEKQPDQYAMYFNCNSSLVPTFRIVYKGVLSFEGNRAITFKLDEELPVDELKDCIRAALRYHKVKQLPTLGI